MLMPALGPIGRDGSASYRADALLLGRRSMVGVAGAGGGCALSGQPGLRLRRLDLRWLW